ncbi:GTP-binding protein, partial [Arenimonas sp.]|nr:GTP-binding protein [Candidatus Parcubacteria bacterium]
IKKPNSSPYQVIHDSMQQGLGRLNVRYGTSTANKMMRPWLQDFSIYGVDYNPPEVKAQIKALDDLGVKSYLLWNASNRYTKGVMEKY